VRFINRAAQLINRAARFHNPAARFIDLLDRYNNRVMRSKDRVTRLRNRVTGFPGRVDLELLCRNALLPPMTPILTDRLSPIGVHRCHRWQFIGLSAVQGGVP
jgi:hypothetical protein